VCYTKKVRNLNEFLGNCVCHFLALNLSVRHDDLLFATRVDLARTVGAAAVRSARVLETIADGKMSASHMVGNTWCYGTFSAKRATKHSPGLSFGVDSGERFTAAIHIQPRFVCGEDAWGVLLEALDLVTRNRIDKRRKEYETLEKLHDVELVQIATETGSLLPRR
jgi:hypothetical protein